MSFVITRGIFRATCWLWQLAELLQCGGAGERPGLWGRAAGRPRVGFLNQGMGCCLRSPLAPASSWACRELMPGKVFCELSSSALPLLRKTWTGD